MGYISCTRDLLALDSVFLASHWVLLDVRWPVKETLSTVEASFLQVSSSSPPCHERAPHYESLSFPVDLLTDSFRKPISTLLWPACDAS